MRRLLALALLVLALPAAAQPPQEVLFPGQTGAELRTSIRAAYRPATLLSEAAGKDRLYDTIDRTSVGGQDGVIGVYTGFFVPFDCTPSCDPSQDVYNEPNQNTQGINQEHTWPQAYLNGSGSAAAERDLHHLFPTKVDVNNDRGSLPFAEIPDEQTSRWYRDALSQTAPPPLAERDAYSELRTGTSFEPREKHEGDVARALFYVRTVYDDEADAAWFEPQMRPLYAWHALDPVDQAEYDRTFRVASFQGDTPNPFVLDSTLIRRAYPEITATATEPGPPAVRLVVSPNPFRDGAVLRLTLPAAGPARVEVFDALGRRVALLHDGPLPGGAEAVLRLDGGALPPGLYVARVTAGAFVAARRLVRMP